MQTLIDALDRDRVRAAVEQAETRTAGEIVPVVVPKSDEYEVATWRGAVFGGLIGLVAVLLVLQFYSGWALGWLYTPGGVALVVLGTSVLGGALTTTVPVLRRRAAGSDLLDETVHRRALQAFVEEEVFNTRDRTGILIFVSLLEHRVEVLGDTGINQHVQPDDWVEVVDCIREGIRHDHFTDGLVEAVQLCGRLLERRGMDAGPGNKNELPNTVRTPESKEGSSSTD
ncbi:MAG: TPM domain-containing protein [Salinivenus sp.]